MVAGGVPAMCDGVTQGQAGMDLSLFSRDTIALGTAVASLAAVGLEIDDIERFGVHASDDIEPPQQTELAMLGPYDAINFKPPKAVIYELERGLEWHAEGHSGDGLKPETVAWARRLARGADISPDKARKMRAWP